MMEDPCLAARTAFGELDRLVFPPGSSIKEVESFHADLVLYDAYVAGLLLNERRVDKLPAFDEELLERTQAALKRWPEASDELSLYIQRLRKIREVLALFRICEEDARGDE